MKKKFAIGTCIAALCLIAALSFGQIDKAITIHLDAAISEDVIDAYAWQFQYSPTIIVNNKKVPNPESKGAFASRMFTEQAQANIRSIYKSYKTYQGSTAAAAQADTDSLGITVQ